MGLPTTAQQASRLALVHSSNTGLLLSFRLGRARIAGPGSAPASVSKGRSRMRAGSAIRPVSSHGRPSGIPPATNTVRLIGSWPRSIRCRPGARISNALPPAVEQPPCRALPSCGSSLDWTNANFPHGPGCSKATQKRDGAALPQAACGASCHMAAHDSGFSGGRRARRGWSLLSCVTTAAYSLCSGVGVAGQKRANCVRTHHPHRGRDDRGRDYPRAQWARRLPPSLLLDVARYFLRASRMCARPGTWP